MLTIYRKPQRLARDATTSIAVTVATAGEAEAVVALDVAAVAEIHTAHHLATTETDLEADAEVADRARHPGSVMDETEAVVE